VEEAHEVCSQATKAPVPWVRIDSICTCHFAFPVCNVQDARPVLGLTDSPLTAMRRNGEPLSQL
jgi:hypothetical protein